MSLSVVIPSKNADNLVPCVEAVRGCEPGVRIIVVDDGLDLTKSDAAHEDHCWMCSVDPVHRIPGVKPFIFARNINIGINAAGRDDVVLLNDDALLMTPGGFSTMAATAAERPDLGLIASSCNNVGNPAQWPKNSGGLRDEPRMVCFVCVFIPRRTIDTVGLLDERYVGYGMDDDDYCWSVRKAGLKLAIDDRCFVDHKSLHSSYRGDPKTPADFIPNLRRFKEKWGFDNWGHS